MRRALGDRMDAEELRQRSAQFSRDVITFCDTLPKDQATYKITGQLIDAATSAAQNYRAACRGRSHDEFTSKMCVTAEESDEALAWLQSLEQTGKASGPELQRLVKEATELLKIFAKSKATALRNQRQRRNKGRTQ